MHKLQIDGKPFEFSSSQITGASIASMVQKDATYQVWKEVGQDEVDQIQMNDVTDTEGTYWVLPPATGA